jgi:hypothetical protein
MKGNASMSECVERDHTRCLQPIDSVEWNAGYTPKCPGIQQGRFAARRTGHNWEVVFYPLKGEEEEVLVQYPLDASGEVLAKNAAVEKLEEVWFKVK